MPDIAGYPIHASYKQTKVAWLDEVPDHWQEFPLLSKAKLKSITNQENEDLLSVYLDKGVIKFDDVEQKRTNVTSLDLSKYQLVEVGDFVLNNQQAWRGSVGVSPHKGIVSPAYLVLSLNKDLLPQFANYIFRDGSMVSQYLVCSKGVGTIQRNLYWPQLKRVPIVIPPLVEQTAIANFLDQKTAQIDEAIAIKEKQIALLKERKQIIIQKAVTQGLDPNVPMKDSGVDWIGQIPAHWERINFRHLIEVLTDYTANGSFADLAKNVVYLDEPSYSRLVRLTDLRKNLENDGVYVSKKSHEYLKKSALYGGELLMANVGAYAGLAWLMPTLGMPSTLAPNMFMLKVKRHQIITKYVIRLLNSESYWQYISTIAQSSAQPKLNKENVRSLPILVPPINEQEIILKHLSAESKRIELGISELMLQIDKLKEYKSVLINSAVTGKIKIA